MPALKHFEELRHLLHLSPQVQSVRLMKHDLARAIKDLESATSPAVQGLREELAQHAPDGGMFYAKAQ